MPSFQLTSGAFRSGQPIPEAHAHDGISPMLRWSDPPEGAESFALLCEDPDAPGGTFTHWIVSDIPATARGLEKGVARESILPDGTRQGVNDFGIVGWRGPAPPAGNPHHYVFRLYALDRKLDLPRKATREHLQAAARGHVLAETELVGTYATRARGASGPAGS